MLHQSRGSLEYLGIRYDLEIKICFSLFDRVFFGAVHLLT